MRGFRFISVVLFLGCYWLLFAVFGVTAAMGDEQSPASAEGWAYQPLVRPDLPEIAEKGQKYSPVDVWILARLEKQELHLAPPASRRELLRRAKFDLHGLPPTREELDAFLNDTAPGAYERLLDRLLESPHYGERWGRMWLDLVRFSDTAGYNADPLRPLAYKYRDYVIQSFNADKPYDRFVREQLAGDELFPDDPAALIATGYLRMPPDESNASNVELARQDFLNDVTGSIGAVFLGQSLGCAQCHDHKFDPISQADFYRIQAFFAGMIPVESVPVADAETQADYQARLDAWYAMSAVVRNELHELETTARAKAAEEKRLKFPEIVLNAIDTAPENRTALQHQLCFFAERQIELNEKSVLAQLKPEQQARREELKAELETLKKDRPQPPQPMKAMVTVDGDAIPTVHRLSGGSYNKPLEELTPGFLTPAAFENDVDARIEPPRPGTSGRRTALANWITDPRNPLTARVIANRVWQGHFGRGIADNANDFGVQSPKPTHPELLDWLATELIARKWSLKQLHRVIMQSAVYRQAGTWGTAEADADAREIDGDNALYWHFSRRRLDAESIRDSLLAVSGQLEPKMYGPGVRPKLPANFNTRESWSVSPELSDRNRRSVYILAKRNLPYPLLGAFDLPDMHESCARRSVTTTAPQALLLLNSELVLDQAEALAGRVLLETPRFEPQTWITESYRLALARTPDQEEIAAATAFLKGQQSLIAERLQAGEQVLLPRSLPKFIDPAQAAAFVDFCHVLVNSNEFLYVD